MANERYVTVGWLQGRLGDAGVRIVDVRTTIPALELGYAWGHIPGAVEFDSAPLFPVRNGIPGKLVDVETAAGILSKLGIAPDATVVIYDEGTGPLGARLAWLLDYLGHADTRILVGGWEAWTEAGAPVSHEPARVEPVPFAAQPTAARVASTDWLAANLGTPGLVLVDARTVGEYSRGHIPGARPLDWEESLTEDGSGQLRPAAELQRRFAQAGVTPDKHIVVYCETGARSSHTYWVLKSLGYPDVRNYEGSWAEWSRQQPPLPVERGHATGAQTAAAVSETPAADIAPCGITVGKAKPAPKQAPAIAGRVSREDLVAQAKAQIKETTVHELKERKDRGEPFTLVDIRELDEYEQGFIPGARHIPRGFLELRIEDFAGNRDENIILYCAGGVRSALAAKNLQEMGYKHVESVSGGFTGWKNAGYDFNLPRVLTKEQRVRYARHLTIAEFGEESQLKLLDSKVLLIGAGGLGSPAAMYLAAAGVGTIGIVDYDTVDVTNLQRQILHRTEDIGRLKVDSAADTLRGINPEVKVVGHQLLLDSSNALDILGQYDVVLNGSDNFPTRYLVNDACVLLGKPLVDASMFIFEGQLTVYDPKRGGPCYRCLYPDPPPPGEVPSCAEAGILGVLPGIVGSLQAIEAIKLLTGLGEPLVGKMLMFDALSMSFRTLKIERDPACPVSGDNPTLHELIDYQQFCGLPSLGGHDHSHGPLDLELAGAVRR